MSRCLFEPKRHILPSHWTEYQENHKNVTMDPHSLPLSQRWLSAVSVENCDGLTNTGPLQSGVVCTKEGGHSILRASTVGVHTMHPCNHRPILLGVPASPWPALTPEEEGKVHLHLYLEDPGITSTRPNK